MKYSKNWYPKYSYFDGESYAGYIPTTSQSSDGWENVMGGNSDHKKKTGALFFWMFVPNQPIDDDSLTIWMNGGPGCRVPPNNFP